MTLSITWLRRIKDCEELIIASDSRLNGGMRWDQCPKIITLPRSDCAICFAGSSFYTYPLMTQLYNAIDSYTRSRERAMDLHDLRGYTINTFNEMQKSIVFGGSIRREDELKDTEFIFAGYSWIRKQFSFWNIHYSTSEKVFKYRPPHRIGKFGKILFAGDWKNQGLQKLRELLQSRYGNNLESIETNGFDMEPFEALRDLLNNSTKEDTIGGPPQIVKIYQHMNCRPIGVYWSDKKSGSATLLGRTLFDYEDSDNWFLDPYTLQTQRRL